MLATSSSLKSPPYQLWIGRGVFALFVAYLLFRAWRAGSAPFEQVDWAFQSSDEVIAWLMGLARREVALYVLAFLLGIVIPPARVASTQTAGRSLLIEVILGLAIVSICLGIAWNEMPPLGSLLLPFVSYLAGRRLSSAALRGARPFLWATGQLAALALLLIVALAIAARMALATVPLDIDATALSPTAKRQFARRIRASRPPPGQPRQLQLADAEINGLVNSALGRGGAQRKASLHFEPTEFTAQASLALPARWGSGKFLNAQVTGNVSIENGHLKLGLRRLRLGRLAAPTLLLRLLSSSIHAMLMDDPQVHRIIEAIVSLDAEPGAINIVFRPGALTNQVVPSLVQLLWERPDVSTQTGIYLRRLAAVFPGLPTNSDRFGALLQTAFALAAQRSRTHDPLLENRAAVFALAILLGHPDLEPFVGELFDPELRAQAAQMIDTVTLRGRSDWPRHFLVSGMMALLSNESTSDRVGLFKEQLDAQQGGSGFSFADLMANLAGIRWATAATRDKASAVAVQTRLARGFDVDAFFPPTADLPENIPAAEFQGRYGGVGGPGYQAVLAQINARLAALPPL